MNATRRGRRLVFTGHSLGAALATLAASRAGRGDLFTFGSPRVGNQAFCETLGPVAARRYVDCCDIVTHLPPQGATYRHVGELRYIGADRRVTIEPPQAAVIADQTAGRIAYMLEYGLKLGAAPGRGLADHSAINYVWPIAATGAQG